MRILMVSAYPPIRDGIANYAVQEVKQLRAQGHDVEVLSPQPSAAHHHLDLRSARGPLALAKRLRAYDRVIIQYHPDLFYSTPLTSGSRERATLGLIGAFSAARDLEIRVHEVNYEWGREAGRHARLTRALWRRPSRIFVHTETERQAFIDAFDVPADRVRLIGHGDNFVRRTAVTRDEARALLGIDPDRFVFLSIGFIQPHKGFDRAVRAFADLGLEGCRFDVVGSLRVEEPAYVAYLTELRRVVDATPNAHLHTGYVSDEAFDQWLVAVDCLVLPYRHIWSSGVLERAALYDTPVIVTAVGGIESQAPPGTIVISDDLELRAAMRRVAGADEPIASHDEVSWDADQLSDQTAVAAAVHRAAMAERGRAPRRFSDLEALAGQSLRAAHADTSSRQRGDAPSREAFDTLPHLIHPVPRGRSAVGSLGKRLAQRLTYWEVQPIIDHVNRLQDAVRDSLDHRAEGPEDAGR